MDPFTHALSGALLVRATAPFIRTKIGLPVRLSVMSGFAAALFPDVDFALRLIDTLTYLNWHQGPTHSLLLLPIWAWLLAYLFSCMARGKYNWKMFYLPVCLGLAIHIAGDLITAYGLMLFAPISTQRFYLPLAFVIDPWLTAIIVAGLLASWLVPKQSIFALLALILLVVYVGVLGLLHDRALTIGQEYARNAALTQAQVNVLPQPFSPFHWKIIVSNNDGYHVAQVNLRQNADKPVSRLTIKWLDKISMAYRPLSSVQWQILAPLGTCDQSELACAAWSHPEFAPFRQFAVFPVLDRIDKYDGEICVWFFDLRFQFPVLPPSFRYGLCRQHDDSEWHVRRQRGTFWLD